MHQPRIALAVSACADNSSTHDIVVMHGQWLDSSAKLSPLRIQTSCHEVSQALIKHTSQLYDRPASTYANDVSRLLSIQQSWSKTFIKRDFFLTRQEVSRVCSVCNKYMLA